MLCAIREPNAPTCISRLWEEIELEVSDNGIGFDMLKSPTDFAPNGHFGLLGIHERADLIGARLEVESAPGKGTKLRIRL